MNVAFLGGDSAGGGDDFDVLVKCNGFGGTGVSKDGFFEAPNSGNDDGSFDLMLFGIFFNRESEIVAFFESESVFFHFWHLGQ